MLGTSSAAGLWTRRETIRSVNFVDTTVKRGEIYYADLSPVVGSEQGGVRPVLIVQNDTGNRHSPTVIAAAITSQMGKAKLPTHIELQAMRYGLPKESVILLEQGSENRITALRPQEAFARLLSQCAYYQRDAASAARMTELAAQLVTNVPVRQLTCRADGDAVRTLEEELRRS